MRVRHTIAVNSRTQSHAIAEETLDIADCPAVDEVRPDRALASQESQTQADPIANEIANDPALDVAPSGVPGSPGGRTEANPIAEGLLKIPGVPAVETSFPQPPASQFAKPNAGTQRAGHGVVTSQAWPKLTRFVAGGISFVTDCALRLYALVVGPRISGRRDFFQGGQRVVSRDKRAAVSHGLWFFGRGGASGSCGAKRTSSEPSLQCSALIRGGFFTAPYVLSIGYSAPLHDTAMKYLRFLSQEQLIIYQIQAIFGGVHGQT